MPVFSANLFGIFSIKYVSFFLYRYAIQTYLIGLGQDENGDNIQINVPEGYQNAAQFGSTLGHKVNHDFLKNKATFNYAMHPRHGWIRTVIAIEDIYKGDEIFINYHYPITDNPKILVPQWYQELYEAQIEPWPRSKK